jgi:hypothetical protein|tara:strand:- start:39 stop:641 length:603 start_codon:yes stop_codon:yes gene_type:complete
MKSLFMYIGLAIFAVILLMMAKEIHAEGCDSTTNSNCIETNSNTNSTVNSTLNSETTVKSPPPSAMSPTINNSNSDLCTVGMSGAVQTQILGVSIGSTTRDMNCERLKNAKVLYDMGMKVAAVSVLCQDKRVFESMMNAGTPCPFDGLVGQPAKDAWNNNPHLIPEAKTGSKEEWNDDTKNTATGVGAVISVFLALLFAF